MDRFAAVPDIFNFIVQSKRWWMVPIAVMLVLVVAFVVVAESSAIAPFIYSLF